MRKTKRLRRRLSKHLDVSYSCISLFQSSGPFLERPGIVAQFLAHKPVNFASLNDSFIISLSNFDLECKYGIHKLAFRARKAPGTLEKQAPGLTQESRGVHFSATRAPYLRTLSLQYTSRRDLKGERRSGELSSILRPSIYTCILLFRSNPCIFRDLHRRWDLIRHRYAVACAGAESQVSHRPEDMDSDIW